MDYAEAREAFFQPRPGATSQARWDTPARALRDALEPLATVVFWAEPAYTRYAALGLDFLTGYVWSRSSVLGEAEPGVVAAAFAVFEPGAVAGLLAAGRAACSLEAVREARVAAATEALREVVVGEDGDVAGAADALLAAARALDVAGRPMLAGGLGQPVPTDPHARLWHAATLLREARGDSHVAACVAAGLDGLEANLLTERWVGYAPQAYAGSRAWSPEAMEAAEAALHARGLLDGEGLTSAGRALREDLEQRTDAAVAPALDALGPRLDDVVPRCRTWGDALVTRGWFPPDAYKRAAG